MKWRKRRDGFWTASLRSSVFLANGLALLVIGVLLVKALPVIGRNSLGELLFSSSWHPLRGDFGFFPFIVGSLAVTAIAMLLAVPVCLLSAVYLVEYVRPGMREVLRLFVDILAGIPSVLYGLFGVIVIVPLVSLAAKVCGVQSTGYSVLAGGAVLAVMVIPFIISITMEVFLAIPGEARETALALGATTWEMVRHVTLKHGRQGIVAAVILGFARAFGETMAVMMVVGNVPQVPRSPFDAVYPLPALIANNYGEMMSVPLYDSALLFAALLLMLVVGGFSLVANLVLLKLQERKA